LEQTARVGALPSQNASATSVFGVSTGTSMELSESVQAEMARTREKMEAAEALGEHA
jgi:hypothetical protein